MPSPPENPDPLRRLLEVMAALRGEGGCPWDREQTHASLVPFLIEEAYELIEAVETESAQSLREELGDVLLQVVFHARMAEERGDFSMDDVAAGIADKMVERHPHVFGETPLATSEEVRQTWHERKMKTRKSAMEGIPSGQPALAWAGQVGARAARTGFEWRALEEIFAKVREEVVEIEQEIPLPDGEKPHQKKAQNRSAALEEEVGDLLFAVTQLSRWLKINPEAALRAATRKFITRFQRMETALHEQGEQPAQLQPEQWWALWGEAKKG